MNVIWKTSRREITFEKTLVMAILNVTPDSFSDGGKFFSIDDALRQTEKFINEGANILDVGGESTRPDSERVSVEEEIKRVFPAISEIKKRFDIPVSIDTSKAEVAQKAVEAGAEIINDISGLRFDKKMVEVAAKNKTGLVLMHLRGEFETMHKQIQSENIFDEISNGFRWSLLKAEDRQISHEQIVLDVGIGFGKTLAQNLELIAKLDKICQEFSNYPILVGASRKSFIGKILGGAATEERLFGTIAANALAVWNGAKILRVHDVKAAVDTIKTVEAIKNQR
ncbi:MAG: dihydropteroate synthase [Pyrinomonadaceae bacterium]